MLSTVDSSIISPSEYVNMTDRTYMDIDNYQNIDIDQFIEDCIKPNIHISDNIQSVSINGIKKAVNMGKGIFDINDGELVLAPGSSGWKNQLFRL